jgi:hypothetical protein
VDHVVQRVGTWRRSTCSRCSPRRRRAPPRRPGRRGGPAGRRPRRGLGRVVRPRGRGTGRPGTVAGPRWSEIPLARGGPAPVDVAWSTTGTARPVTWSPVTGRPDRGRRRALAVQRPRCARPRPGPRTTSPSRSGRSTTPSSTRRCSGSGSRRRRGPLDPAPGCAPARSRARAVRQVGTSASREATVLEVRVDDRPGVVYLVCARWPARAVGASAHRHDLGPQAVDVFYVQELGAGVCPTSVPPRRCTRSVGAPSDHGYP